MSYATFYSKITISSVRNSLPSNGGPIGPLGSEVQWPLVKLDGPKLFKKFFLTNCLFNLLKVTRQKDTKVIYVKFLYSTSSLNTNYTRCTQREQNARLHVTSLESYKVL